MAIAQLGASFGRRVLHARPMQFTQLGYWTSVSQVKPRNAVKIRCNAGVADRCSPATMDLGQDVREQNEHIRDGGFRVDG